MRIFQIAAFFLVQFLFSPAAQAQKEGDTWVIGYYSEGNPNYSVMHLEFTNAGNLELNWHFDEQMSFSETAANICDANGEAILWTNGMQVFGKHGQFVADTIAYGPGELSYWEWFNVDGIGPIGFPEHDGAIFLPVPDHDGEFLLLYHYYNSVLEVYDGIPQYRHARVRMSSDTVFSVLYKDSIFLEHQYLSGTISATKHANGRDWWVLVMEATGSRYFVYLLSPDGLSLHHIGNVDIALEEGAGQARFSPQGNYFVRRDGIDSGIGQFITLFSFDRCNGELTYLDQFQIELGIFTGAAISPTEHYLFANDNKHLWQWDLWATDIAASQTLVDTFDGFIQPGWFEMRFGPIINGPDGRIYIIPPAGSSEFIHVIDRPDEPASACAFRQHSINLKVPNGRSAPNIPNFRLGPIDGSECDTLGINNIPEAWWRYEEQEPGWPQEIRFTDLSFFDPHTWHWDFGDGETSDEVNPIHTFGNGLYHVCLTVSNTYGQDSLCRWVEILPVSTVDASSDAPNDLSIAPNPFHDELEVRSKRGDIRPVEMRICDMYGKEILYSSSAPVPVVMHVPHWTPGIYLVTIRDEDGSQYSFKVMKGE